MLLLILAPLAVYAAICGAVYFFQAALVFPVSQVRPAGPPPPGATRLELRASTGERLAGLHVPPAAGEGEAGLPPVILGFGGNGMTYSRIAADIISAEFDGRRDPDADLYAPGRRVSGATRTGFARLDKQEMVRSHAPISRL